MIDFGLVSIKIQLQLLLAIRTITKFVIKADDSFTQWCGERKRLVDGSIP